MADLTRLEAAVTANTAAVKAVSDEVAKLKAADNQAAVDALAATIETNNVALDALIPPVTSTPA